MKEGGGLVGGTCEHCEDRAPSGPRQDSVRTLSGLCQDSVRTLSGLSGQVREVHKPGYPLDENARSRSTFYFLVIHPPPPSPRPPAT